MSTFFVVHSDGELEAFDEKIDAERSAEVDSVVICGRIINPKAAKFSTPQSAGDSSGDIIEEEEIIIEEEEDRIF